MMVKYSGRVALQQRVLPDYRTLFFNRLGDACEGGLSVFAGKPNKVEGIKIADSLTNARYTSGRNIHLFDPSSSMYICWQVHLMSWLKRWNPDTLIVEANPRYLSTGKAIQWMKKRHKHVIGWGLGAPMIKGKFARIRQHQRMRFLRSLDAVISYSERGAKEYQAVGIDPARIFVAHNAVTLPPDFPYPDRQPNQRSRINILFVGRLQYRKRLDLLFKACADLPKEIQPNLTIVGEGPDQDEFKKIAHYLTPNANFVGSKHGKELEGYFLDADLFVLPGTGGLAVQQAMTYGLPVIVAQGDGTQDDLVRPENGWQIPQGDEIALRETLIDAMMDLSRLRQMGEESYRIIKEEINVTKMVETFVKALNYIEKNF